MLRNHFNKALFSIVLFGFSGANAGSFDDFFQAIRQDNAGAIERLLKRGFDVNTKDEKGQPPLVFAIKEGTDRAIAVLLDWPKTNLNLKSEVGETALMMAAIKGRDDLVAKLVKKGADVNQKGWTPLHYAASGGTLATMKLLLENNAYIDAESPNGTTPLMMAARYGSSDGVRLLLQEGADPTLRSQRNLTALDFAHTADRADVIRMVADAQRSWSPKASGWPKGAAASAPAR